MYTEIKYLNLLSIRLDKFKQKKDYLWNFRCPICGDSQKNKNKARGFVFQVKGKLRFKCHNCGASHTFENFLEGQDPSLYKQYRMEKFEESGKSKKPDLRKIKKLSKVNFENVRQDTLSNLTPIDSLNKEHPAREYLLNRKLPTESLYFTEKFQEWVNSVKPNTFPSIEKDEERIIIPFIDKRGNCFGFQGRSLHNTGLRYITVLLQEGAPKIFGLNRLDTNKTVYICEGPLDALLLENGCAMAGADVSPDALTGCDLVYIYDNEPRNKEICSRIESHIKRGDSVVIWPSNIKEKDINDMHLTGLQVQSVIDSHTFKGLTATLKLKDWTKV